MIGDVTFPICSQYRATSQTGLMSFGYFSFNFAFVQVFRSSAIYFGIVCILGVSFNLGILLLYLSTKKVWNWLWNSLSLSCAIDGVLWQGEEGPHFRWYEAVSYTELLLYVSVANWLSSAAGQLGNYRPLHIRHRNPIQHHHVLEVIFFQWSGNIFWPWVDGSRKKAELEIPKALGCFQLKSVKFNGNVINFWAAIKKWMLNFIQRLQSANDPNPPLALFQFLWGIRMG